jgi:hypothetical protein
VPLHPLQPRRHRRQGTTITNPSSILSSFLGPALLWLAARAYRGIRISSTLTLR